MKLIALIGTITTLGLAAPAVASAAEFEGTIRSVDRDAKTFRIHDSERGTFRIKVNAQHALRAPRGPPLAAPRPAQHRGHRPPLATAAGSRPRSSARAAAATTAATTTNGPRSVPAAWVGDRPHRGAGPRSPPGAPRAVVARSPGAGGGRSPPSGSLAIAAVRATTRRAACRPSRRLPAAESEGLPGPLRVGPGARGRVHAPGRHRLQPPALPALPGGVLESAERTARWRPAIEAAARDADVDPDTLEGLVFLESAGRDDAVTPGGHRGRRRADADPRRDGQQPARHEGRHQDQRPPHPQDRTRRRRPARAPAQASARRPTSASTAPRRWPPPGAT